MLVCRFLTELNSKHQGTLGVPNVVQIQTVTTETTSLP